MRKIKKIFLLFIFICFQLIYPKSKDTYFCGIATGYPPYQYVDKNGNPAGVDYEVSKAVFEKAGLKVIFVQKPWDEVLLSVMHNDGKIDILCGVEINDIRKKSLIFTNSYYQRNIVIFTLAKSDIENISDLNGKIITGDRHTSIEAILKSDKNRIRVIQTESKEESFLKLKKGEVVAVIAPLEVGKYLAKKLNLEVKILEEKDVGTPVALAVYKTQKALGTRINDALKKLILDGTIEKIMKKYK